MIEDSCRMLRAASSRLQTLRAICGLSRRRFILMIAIGQLAALDAMGGVAANPFRALPLAFEQNQGQADPRAKYLTRGAAMEMFFLTDATRLVKHDSASSSVLDIRLVGARTNVEPLGTNLLPQRTSHIKGAAPSDNVTDIRAFAGVRYEAIYPGIDLVYYGTGGELEYDLLVMPHANPGMIQLAFEGAQSIRLSDAGNLILGTESGDVEFRRPVAYQDIGGERCPVAASYVLTPRKEVAFELGEYDRNHRLVIDPVLSLSTSLWGNAAGVALDSARNIYVVGSIWNSGLPASNGYQTQLGGSQDAYVIKLNPSGTAVLYATYLGARRVTTTGSSIAVDGAGSAYVTGTTANGFPVTPGAYLSSGTTFITKLNPAGNGLVYSTYVTAPVVSLAVDSAGQTYMTGTATTLTTTPGSLQGTKTGASAPYVAKLAASGASMIYATYLGGSGNDEGRRIAVDSSGNAYVVGVARSVDFPLRGPFSGSLAGATDAFVAKLNATGTALVYSTYLGGSGNERGLGIAVDPAGQAYVTGWTSSTNFPITAGAFQRTIGYPDPSVSNAFITKLNAAGNGLVYSSYLGGKWCLTPNVFQCFGIFSIDEGIDAGTAIAVDAAGYAYVGGYVTSTLFPLVDSVQAVTPLDADVWHVPLVAKVAPDGDRLSYATVVGTKVQDGGVTQIAVDGQGGVVATGNVPNEYFPLSAGAVVGTGNAFLFKLDVGNLPTSVNSSPNPASPGQPVTLTATTQNPTPNTQVVFKEGAATLGTASVMNGRAALVVNLPPGVHRITGANTSDNVASGPYFQIVRGQ